MKVLEKSLNLLLTNGQEPCLWSVVFVHYARSDFSEKFKSVASSWPWFKFGNTDSSNFGMKYEIWLLTKFRMAACWRLCYYVVKWSNFYSSSLLLFATPLRYVPNVAKRSIWDQCKKKYILMTDRQTDDLTFGKFQAAISPRGVVRSTSCLVLWWGFRGRRIEWRYFRFRQIQDGSSAAILENSNGDISAAHYPIYSMFGSSMGFSGSVDRMALFPVSPNLGKFKWRYLRGGSSDLLRVWF